MKECDFCTAEIQQNALKCRLGDEWFSAPIDLLMNAVRLSNVPQKTVFIPYVSPFPASFMCHSYNYCCFNKYSFKELHSQPKKRNKKTPEK
jgi:hypothetical protein